MRELQELVNKKVESMVNDGTVQAIIESGVEKAIVKAIEGQFDTWGAISKAMKEALENGLKIDLNELPFETYNQQMAAAVHQRANKFFADEGLRRLQEELDKVFEPAPQEMAIHEFVEKIVEFWKVDNPCEAEDVDECATVRIEKDSKKYFSIKMWKQLKSSYLSGENSPCIHVFVLNGKIGINHRHRYNPTCFNQVDEFIFRLYAAGTKITGIEDFDEYDCDLRLHDWDY